MVVVRDGRLLEVALREEVVVSPSVEEVVVRGGPSVEEVVVPQ